VNRVKLLHIDNLIREVMMYTEEHTQMLIQIATLLDIEYEEVKKFMELMLGGYNFEDGVNGCSLTTAECKLILVEIQKRKPKS
jgi:hypothetical protein|tara:strand:- start:226 stop:474 length:249 start_codon:yes stop_codon:yes gene_type:complete